MATYNGATFLKAQLDSLAKQKILPFELVIGDDGSTDETLEIIENFARQSPFPVYIEKNQFNLGYSENFLQIARRCQGEWVAFCDQDDIWLPDKISMAVESISRNPSINIILQKAEICDANLNRTGRVFPNSIPEGIYGPNSQYGFWVWLGFLQTVRSELFKKYNSNYRPQNYFRLDGIQSHDKWTCMIANALGGIHVIDTVVAYYRRHDKALTGNYSQQSLLRKISNSRSINSLDYIYLANVASQTAEILRNKVLINTSDHKISLQIDDSASWFDLLAEIQILRADIYSSNVLIERLQKFIKLWKFGGYLGHPFVSMGLASALKDILVVLFGTIKERED